MGHIHGHMCAGSEFTLTHAHTGTYPQSPSQPSPMRASAPTGASVSQRHAYRTHICDTQAYTSVFYSLYQDGAQGEKSETWPQCSI